MFQCLPDDPKIVEMDYIKKIWMFNNWMEDKADEFQVSEHNGYMIGSFINPEQVDKMLNNKGKHKSTDEEFDETSEMVKNNDLGIFKDIFQTNPNGEVKKRKRKLIKGS